MGSKKSSSQKRSALSLVYFISALLILTTLISNPVAAETSNPYGSPIMLSTPDNLVEFDLEFAYEKSIQAPFTVVSLNKETKINAPLISFSLDAQKNVGGIKGRGETGQSMRFKPIIVDLFSSSLHQVHGNDKLYPLEIHVTHEDKEGNRIVLVILYETAQDGQRAHILDEIGLKDFDVDSVAFEVDNMSLSLSEAVGDVSSYFAYYGCPVQLQDQNCHMEETVLYVVLTDLHPIGEDQVAKLTELGGCSNSEGRMIYEKGTSRYLRLAVKEDQPEQQLNIAQTYIEVLKKPDAVKKASLPDTVFSSVMDSFFNKAAQKKTHIMLAQVSGAMKMQLPSVKPEKLELPQIQETIFQEQSPQLVLNLAQTKNEEEEESSEASEELGINNEGDGQESSDDQENDANSEQESSESIIDPALQEQSQVEEDSVVEEPEIEELEVEQPEALELEVEEPEEEEPEVEEPEVEEQIIEEPIEEELTEDQSVDQDLDEEEPLDLIYDNEYEWKTDAAEEEEPDERRGEIQYYTKDELKQSTNRKVVNRALSLVRSFNKPGDSINRKKRLAATLLSIEELVDYDQFDKSERSKYRKVEIGDFADWARNYANEGVGKKRTENFDVAVFLPLMPLDRVTVDPAKILRKMEDNASDQLLNTKTRKLRDFEIIPRIIERLEDRTDDQDLSVIQDVTKSSYHDSTRNHNVLLMKYQDVVLGDIRSEAADQAYESLDKTVCATLDAVIEEKKQFLLYESLSFLMDEGIASIELIGQSVMLSESGVTERVTTAFAQNPLYKIERPHRLNANNLIQEALETNVFNNWTTVGQGRILNKTN